MITVKELKEADKEQERLDAIARELEELRAMNVFKATAAKEAVEKRKTTAQFVKRAKSKELEDELSALISEINHQGSKKIKINEGGVLMKDSTVSLFLG